MVLLITEERVGNIRSPQIYFDSSLFHADNVGALIKISNYINHVIVIINIKIY